MVCFSSFWSVITLVFALLGPPPQRSWSKAKSVSSHSDSDGMGSIPASPDALNVPLLLCQEWFNEASLPAGWISTQPKPLDCSLDCVQKVKFSVEQSIPIISVGNLFHVQPSADEEIKRYDRVENR